MARYRELTDAQLTAGKFVTGGIMHTLRDNIIALGAAYRVTKPALTTRLGGSAQTPDPDLVIDAGPDQLWSIEGVVGVSMTGGNVFYLDLWSDDPGSGRISVQYAAVTAFKPPDPNPVVYTAWPQIEVRPVGFAGGYGLIRPINFAITGGNTPMLYRGIICLGPSASAVGISWRPSSSATSGTLAAGSSMTAVMLRKG
jgi:hypothetical protein